MNAIWRSRMERDGFKAIPFLTIVEDDVVQYWPTPRQPSGDEERDHKEGLSLGGAYAMALVGYMRNFAEFDMESTFVDVCREILVKGRWGPLEEGFFLALGEFLAHNAAYIGGCTVPLPPASTGD